MMGKTDIPPKLSVIVLVYNAEHYLQCCLNSIIEQEFTDFEVLLIVELHSTDSSLEICQGYAQNDERVRIITENGTGCNAARNRGLDEACGQYIMFVDADDYILPKMFSSMYEEASRQNLDIFYCGSKKDMGNQCLEDMSDYMQFDNNFFAIIPQIQKKVMYKLAINGRAGTVWAKLFKREFLVGKNLRFDSIAYSEDYVFNAMCVMFANLIGTTKDSYYVYCDRPTSRMYSSEISDIKQSAEILWQALRTYNGFGIDEVRAYAAARIVSSSLFSLKLKPLSLETICRSVDEIIDSLNLRPHLEHAADDDRYREYAHTVGMFGQGYEDYLLFIRSLQSYNTMLAWQRQYEKVEGQTNI
ncbi:MAG: glycosyltransferase [Oscillospiraceae bacterium]|nr:glycosyltransferase [Oscillospiraceae bacterium]